MLSHPPVQDTALTHDALVHDGSDFLRRPRDIFCAHAHLWCCPDGGNPAGLLQGARSPTSRPRAHCPRPHPTPLLLQVEDTVPLPDPTNFNPGTFVRTLPGITGPLGFFDPAGFCDGTNKEGAATEGKVRYYREVEVKHGRVAMLAALGFPVAEQFHPLFGGTIDVPSVVAFQQTPLQSFWPIVVLTIAIIEVFSIFPAFENPNVEGWAIKKGHVAGDYGFDPLGLKPASRAALAEMQTKEINNGRLAMIAIAGMVAQELLTGSKLF
eukprot:scaffold25097_cov112-Isochrysis_galbana.AAC.2